MELAEVYFHKSGYSKSVEINNCSNYDQSNKIGTCLLCTIKIIMKKVAKIF